MSMLLSTSKLVKVVGPRRLFSEALECSLPVLAVKNRYLAQEFIGTNYNLYILINCVIYISERKLHMLRDYERNCIRIRLFIQCFSKLPTNCTAIASTKK